MYSIELIQKYFPNLSEEQLHRYTQLQEVYEEWNQQINVISRKDIDQLYLRHVLHSLAIARVIRFSPGTKILDVGTGGGFPGIPLAIMFPEVEFHLVDSIAKKIKVVQEVVNALGLKNVVAEQKRAEKIKDQYDFVVSRAVTAMPRFVSWIRKNISDKDQNGLPNGVLALKGGDLNEELSAFNGEYLTFEINEFFEEDFFETKKVVYLGV
jgi:16S rRNA (guanine527-N7)-methyltransferase